MSGKLLDSVIWMALISSCSSFNLYSSILLEPVKTNSGICNYTNISHKNNPNQQALRICYL